MFGRYADEDDMSPPATKSEAVREWAWIVGQDVPDRAWLLSDYDTWEANPHYAGPAQPHPEDDMYGEGDDEGVPPLPGDVDTRWLDVGTYPDVEPFDDIPF